MEELFFTKYGFIVQYDKRLNSQNHYLSEKSRLCTHVTVTKLPPISVLVGCWYVKEFLGDAAIIYIYNIYNSWAVMPWS